MRFGLFLMLVATLSGGAFADSPATAVAGLPVPNAGFEAAPAGQPPFAPEWEAQICGGAKAAVTLDESVKHGGARSVKITNASPHEASVFASFFSKPIAVEPATTYIVRYWVRGQQAKKCFLCLDFNQGGQHRQYLPSGDFEWRPMHARFTTPEGCTALSLRFASEDVTGGFWVDDISLERSPVQLANVKANFEKRPYPGVFPRTPGRVAERLVVFDASALPTELEMPAVALQGLVNRKQARLYLINKTNPQMMDEVWLNYMKEKGYTGQEERVGSLKELIARFRSEIKGVILYDPAVPGSVNAAWMIGGLEGALPLHPDRAAELGLPTLMDLRGKWKRNVEAYRFVYDNYWPRMSHHLLAWAYPGAAALSSHDYLTQFNVFMFWVSSHGDGEPGADPEAEEEFLEELLAATPPCTPVLGWPQNGDAEGVVEYIGVRRISEYGKFTPGTIYCSNLSVHTAVRPDEKIFRQKSRRQPAVGARKLDPSKLYVSLNILESGDALWYWQSHQRKIWGDPLRGTVPVGYAMNVTLIDALPLVAQWYYENATPRDTFFAALSGLGYMNTSVFGARFCPEDRERAWAEWTRLTADYCRRLDIDGIELYNGSWGEPTPTDEALYRRFTEAMKVDYFMADLGRHECVNAQNANHMAGGAAVFHTLTRFRVWTDSASVDREQMAPNNTWLVGEILANAPKTRPGFMSTMAISFFYYPTWLKNLERCLPPDCVVVSPSELARLYREAQGKK